MTLNMLTLVPSIQHRELSFIISTTFFNEGIGMIVAFWLKLTRPIPIWSRSFWLMSLRAKLSNDEQIKLRRLR